MHDTRNQLLLDFSPATRNSHPDTSREAEQEITDSKTRNIHCVIILNAMRQGMNGSTTKELAEKLKNKLTYPQIWRRMNDLAENEYIERNDKIKRDGCCTWWIL